MIDLKDIKLLIFDFDGTIANTSDLHRIAFEKVLLPFDLSFNYKDIAGKSTYDALIQIFKKHCHAITEAEIKLLQNEKQTYVRELIEEYLEPLDGVDEFLEWALSRFQLAIATSGSKKTILTAIKKLRYEHFFNPILCTEDVDKSKPNPDIFLAALNITKTKKQNALIFEDSLVGFKAAQSAGIKYIDVTNGFFVKFCEKYVVETIKNF